MAADWICRGGVDLMKEKAKETMVEVSFVARSLEKGGRQRGEAEEDMRRTKRW